MADIELAIKIPDNPTNGDVIKGLFQDCVKDDDFGDAVITVMDGETQYWSRKWWNAQYKAESVAEDRNE